MMAETKVVSFVLRFVRNESTNESGHPLTGWYGLIRHVQSGDERHFVHWDDAVAFIAHYVRVDKKSTDGEKGREADGQSQA
jgi:hypothetical protein